MRIHRHMGAFAFFPLPTSNLHHAHFLRHTIPPFHHERERRSQWEKVTQDKIWYAASVRFSVINTPAEA